MLFNGTQVHRQREGFTNVAVIPLRWQMSASLSWQRNKQARVRREFLQCTSLCYLPGAKFMQYRAKPLFLGNSLRFLPYFACIYKFIETPLTNQGKVSTQSWDNCRIPAEPIYITQRCSAFGFSSCSLNAQRKDQWCCSLHFFLALLLVFSYYIANAATCTHHLTANTAVRKPCGTLKKHWDCYERNTNGKTCAKAPR